MAVENIVTTLVSVGGLFVAITGTYITVRNFYDKRRNEDRDRQRQELDRLRVEREAELEKYAEGKQKAYAAERDFQHLMRKYDSLSSSITTLMDYQRNEVQGIETDLKEVKGMLTAVLVELKGSETAVMRFLKKSET